MPNIINILYFLIWPLCGFVPIWIYVVIWKNKNKPYFALESFLSLFISLIWGPLCWLVFIDPIVAKINRK